MIFNELFEKFLNDKEFKEKLLLDIKENGLKTVIDKYNLPYSEEEVKDLIAEKIEAANGASCTTYSIMTIGVGCIVSAVEHDGKVTEECYN